MAEGSLIFHGEQMEARPTGILWLPDARTLIVSDLHLGKAERNARRSGGFWPPYDTLDTLNRLEAEIMLLDPLCVVTLGDSFDDRHCVDHLDNFERERIEQMIKGRRWIWLTGNHDPAPTDLGGDSEETIHFGNLTLRHIAEADTEGEISGHYHPKATMRMRGRRVARKCFLVSPDRIILPAFGAFTGGLDVFDPAFATLFEGNASVVLTGSRALKIPLSQLRQMAA